MKQSAPRRGKLDIYGTPLVGVAEAPRGIWTRSEGRVKTRLRFDDPSRYYVPSAFERAVDESFPVGGKKPARR